MERRQPAGVAIPTALFMVMLLFFLATVVASRTRLDVRFSGLESERTRRLYLARGGVHQAIARMLGDLSWESSHGPGSPDVATEDGVTVETWVESDPNYVQVVHVHSLAYAAGRRSQGQRFSRTVVKGLDLTPTIFVRVEGPLGGPPTIYCYRDDAWFRLPPPPLAFYQRQDDGSLMLVEPPPVPRQFADLTSFVADTQGHLASSFLPADPKAVPTVARCDEQTGRWSYAPLPSPPKDGSIGPVQAYENGLLAKYVDSEGKEQLLVQGAPRYLSEGSGGTAVPDPTTDWTNLPWPTGLPLGASTVGVASTGPSPDVLPPPPGQEPVLLVQFTGTNPDGTPYDALQRWDGSNWTRLPLPRDDAFKVSDAGLLEFVQGTGTAVPDRFTVVPDGRLYAQSGQSLYQFSPLGAWQALPPPQQFSYDPDSGVPLAETGFVDKTTQVTADGVGNLIRITPNNVVYLNGQPLPQVPQWYYKPDGTLEKGLKADGPLPTSLLGAGGYTDSNDLTYRPAASY